MQKSIDARVQEIVDLQQLWLRQQTELVRLTKDQDEQSVDVTKLKKQLTILTQKKARTEGLYTPFMVTSHKYGISQGIGVYVDFKDRTLDLSP